MDNLNKNAEAFLSHLEMIWSFYIDMEKELRGKLDELYKQIQKEQPPSDSDLFPKFHDIDNRYKCLFREGLLIQICSFLEYTMGQVCALLIEEYEKKFKKSNGNWLQKNLGLLNREEITELDSDDVSYFCDFITLRNCFVHTGGKIEQSRRPKEVRKAICNLQKLGQELNTDIVTISNDGYVILGADALPDVVSKGEEIIRAIFEHGFELHAKKT